MILKVKLHSTVPDLPFNQRLDQVLAELFPEYSRSRLKTWIINNKVLVNGKVINKPKEKIFGGEFIDIDADIEDTLDFEPQDIEFNEVYADDDILIINKPVNLIVHPGAGNADGTLLNALLYRYPMLQHVPRAGIVHRLDKDTTGLMIVAKTIPAQTKLVEMIQERKVTREYEALALGEMTAGGTIDEPIGRHPVKRTQMAVNPLGKEAITHYRVMERFRFATRLRVRLDTGRTHQIRVHMAHINHPLLGDPVYSGRLRVPKNAAESLILTLKGFKRQALHAACLMLAHPITGESMQWQAEIPADMKQLVEQLREDMRNNLAECEL